MVARTTNRLEIAMARVRPHIPFTAWNTVWRLLDKQGKTVLDVGCGKAEPMRFINRHKQFHTVGVDIFKPYLYECRKEDAHNDHVLCDIRDLPFKDKSVDIVLCMEVLEHLEREDGLRLIAAMEKIAVRQVILTTPIHGYEQTAYDSNAYQEHRYIWNYPELRMKGYHVKLLGLRNIGGREGLASRLPKPVKSLANIPWVMAGPLVCVFPALAGEMVCSKKM